MGLIQDKLNNRVHSILLAILLAVAILAMMVVPVLAANEFGVKGANVYSGYLEDNDWLIVIEYQNMLEPYYGNDTSIDSFQLQLIDGGTVIAQTPLAAWGYKPGAIYLSATTVASLEWGTAFNVNMTGVANTTGYTLLASDWRGSSLATLDTWCLALASRMENWYNVTFLVPSATATTEVLNEEGGVMFAVGIPYLEQARPNIFQISTYTPGWEDKEWTEAYPESLPGWEVAVGANFAGIFNDLGDTMGIDGQWVGAILLFVVYFALAIGVLGMGHGLAGLVLASPLLMAGFYFKLIPFAVLGVIIAIAALMLVRQFWWKTT